MIKNNLISLLILLLCSLSSIAQNSLKSQKVFDSLTVEYKELQMLYEMKDYCHSIQSHTLSWVYSKTDEHSKRALLKLKQGRTWKLNETYWKTQFKEKFLVLMKNILTLENEFPKVVGALHTFEDYEDVTILIATQDIVESKINPCYYIIEDLCDELIHFQIIELDILTSEYRESIKK